MSDGLAARTARAAQWRFAGSVTSAGLQFALGVILARLLSPDDFGVVALAMVVLGIVKPVSDLGLGSALVQRATPTERQVRAAFAWCAASGVVLTLVLAVCAPLAARIAGDARVAPVVGILSLTLAFRGFGVVAEAMLARRLDFRWLSIIESGSALVGYGMVAIALALSGYGAWSLAWGTVLQSALAAAAALIVVRHSVVPLFARSEIGELLPFGLATALSGWVNYVALNGDNFVVGRWIGTASLGLYGRAYALMSLPFNYTAGVISAVLFPAFAHVQDDPARLRRGFLEASRITGFAAGPAMAVLAIGAPHLVPAIYGSQWSGVVPPLQILCLAGYFRALYHLGGVVIRSSGRAYTELTLQALYATIVVAGSLVGARYGLRGVAVAVVAAIVLMFVATTRVALRTCDATWSDYLRAQRAPLAATGMTLVFALLARALYRA
jgi:teichuronic acid exporter